MYVCLLSSQSKRFRRDGSTIIVLIYHHGSNIRNEPALDEFGRYKPKAKRPLNNDKRNNLVSFLNIKFHVPTIDKVPRRITPA